MNHHDVSTFHISGAGPLDRRIIHGCESLKRTRGFENGVEVPNEKDGLVAPGFSGADVFGDQVAGPIEVLPVYPPCLKPEGIKTSAKYLTDFIHTIEVHGTTVDVYNIFPKLQCLRIVLIYGGDKLFFCAIKLSL